MTSESLLILEVRIQKEIIKICVYERDSTLHPAEEEISISLVEIDHLCEDIIKLLNKSNELGKLATGINSELKKTGQVLYDQLLTNDVKNKFRNTDAKSLLIVIDEGLVQIPWELLFDGKDFLCLKFNMGRKVKTGQTLRGAGRRTEEFPVKMLVLADPTGDLKSARQEAGVIEKELDKIRNNINVAKKVTNISTSFIKRNLRDYQIVHYAGHADYDIDDPSNSGWKLEDGRFTAKDISIMGATAPLPALIFSNSCQSAHTKEWKVDNNFEEKIFGLANAFLCSGVRHYIGCSWKIPDDISLSFAKEFYSQIAQSESVGNAIRKARLKIIKDFGEDTIVWASYILYGDPTNVLIATPNIQRILPDIKKWPIKKIALSTGVVIFVIVCLIGGARLLQNLPTMNFGTYREFKNTWQMFLDGRNQEVIAICKKIIAEDPDYLDAYKRLGNTYDRIGQREKALEVYFEYAKRSEMRQDKSSLANALINIGWIYHAKGNYKEAFEYYQKGLKLSEEIQHKLYQAKAYRQLALWHRHKGNYEEALKLLYKSTEINRDHLREYNHQYDLACDYYNIALIFADKEDWDSAKEFYIKSKEIFEKIQSRNGEAIYFSNMGEYYFYNKEFSKAEEYYKKSLVIDEKMEDKWSISVDYALLGELYYEMEKYEDAFDQLNKSTAIKREIDDRYGLAENFYDIGLLYKKQDNKEKAVESFQQALQLYKSMDIPDSSNIEHELADLGVVDKIGNNKEPLSSSSEYAGENKLTILILPFENLTKDAENIGSGIAEVIITKLSNLKQIKIVDKSLVDKAWTGLKDTKNDNKIWSQFGAKVIVMGAYQKNGDKIRITAKLVDSFTGQVTDTTETFGSYQDIFPLQDTIAFNILAKLDVKITEKEKNTIKEANPTKNLNAFEYFAKSSEHFNKGDYIAALELCKKALELDPQYIQANFGIAQIYEKMSNWDLARSFYEKTKNLAEKQRDKNILLSAYHNFGRFVGVTGDYKTALEYEQKALDISREINSQQSYALILRHMAIVFLGLNQDEKALSAVMESKKIFEESNNIAAMGEVNFTLGLIYSFAKNMDREKGIEYLEKALKIYESIQYKEGILRVSMSLGSPYIYKIGQYDKAIDYLNKAIIVANELNSNIDEISIYNMLADIATRKEEYGTAEEYYRKALEINKGINDKAYADTLYWLAQLNMRQLKHENAITYLQQLVNFCEDKKNYDVLYKSKSEIANAYMTMGRHKDAIEMLEEIDTNIGKISDKLTRNNIKLNLLRAYFKSGNYEKGESIIEEVAALARKISTENISYKPHEAYVLSQIASIYNERSMFDDAIIWYNKSMEVFPNALQDDYSKGILVSVYYGIANCYQAIKNYEKAKEFYNRALPIALEIDDPLINSIKGNLYFTNKETKEAREDIKSEEAKQLYIQANNYFHNGEFEKALGLAREAYKKEPNNDKIVGLLCLIYESMGKFEESIQAKLDYVKLLDQKNNDREVVSKYSWIGDNYRHIGKLDKAKEYYDKALSLALKSNDKESLGIVYADFSLLLENLGEDDKAIEFANKAIVVNQELGKATFLANAYQVLSNVYSRQGDKEKALEYATLNLKVNEESGSADLGKSYTILGSLYQDTDILKSLEYLNKAVDFFKKYNREQPLGNVYHTIGSVYEKSQQIDKALEFYNKSLEISERLNDKWTTMANYLGLEEAYFENKDYKFSADFRNKYEILSKELGKEEEVGLVYGAVGNRYQNVDKGEAEKYFLLSNQILERYKDSKSLKALFINYNALGYMFYKGKDFDKAMSYFQKAIDISKEENTVDQFILAFAYQNLGDCSRVKGNYETTLDAFKTAKTIFTEQKAEQKIIDTLDNEIKKFEHVMPVLDKMKDYDDLVKKAIVYHKEHKWELALEHYKKALMVANEVKDSGKDESLIKDILEREKWLNDEIKRIESYLQEMEASRKTKPAEYLEANAILYIRQNKLDAALENFEKALHIYEEANYQKQIGSIKIRIGLVYLTKNDINSADKSFQEAQAVARKIEDKEFSGIIHGVFGILFEKKGELAKAEKEYDMAINLLKETESEKVYMAAYNNCLGSINYKKKDYRKSLDYYQKALEAGKEIEDPNSICLTNTMIAYINFVTNSFQEANDISDSALAVAESLDDKEIASIVSLIKAKILMKENNYEKAKEFINKAFSYSEILENNKLKLVMYLNLAMFAEMQNDNTEYEKWSNMIKDKSDLNCVINGKISKDCVENLFKEIIEEKDFFKRIWL